MNVTLPREDFAAEVVTQLCEPASEGSWFFDQGEFALILKDATGRAQQTLRLATFYHWYKEINALEPVVQRIVALTRGQADTTNYDQVAPLLLPKIFDRAKAIVMWKQGLLEYGDRAPRFEMYAVGDVFAVMPVIDTGIAQERISNRATIAANRNAGNVSSGAPQLKSSVILLGGSLALHSITARTPVKYSGHALVSELVYESHLKCDARKGLRVRIPPRALHLLEKTSLCNYDSKNPAFLSITVELF